MSHPGETTVSLRWMIPFLRITGADPQQSALLKREGIGLQDFANPDTRIRHRVSMELLARAVTRRSDPELGLRAGESVAAGDFEPLEYAARSCANLREAIHCVNRYMLLIHGAQEAHLIEEGDRATWAVRVTDDVPQHPAANDFTMAASISFSTRYTGVRGELYEVHFLHNVPTNEGEYARIFDGAAIRLGMPHNALVFERALLDLPMLHAHSGLQRAFEMHASAMLERLKRSEGASGRVRQQLVAQLRGGDVSMATSARRIGMSVPTLRRRLSQEGTTHSELLDDVRRELAKHYLSDPSLAMSDVAFLLGFSHVTAFYKAFRRWSQGMTPAEFRAQSARRPGSTPPPRDLSSR